jgi:hypothetical protein
MGSDLLEQGRWSRIDAAACIPSSQCVLGRLLEVGPESEYDEKSSPPGRGFQRDANFICEEQ